jgi:hypothetical protein
VLGTMDCLNILVFIRIYILFKYYKKNYFF